MSCATEPDAAGRACFGDGERPQTGATDPAAACGTRQPEPGSFWPRRHAARRSPRCVRLRRRPEAPAPPVPPRETGRGQQSTVCRLPSPLQFGSSDEPLLHPDSADYRDTPTLRRRPRRPRIPRRFHRGHDGCRIAEWGAPPTRLTRPSRRRTGTARRLYILVCLRNSAKGRCENQCTRRRTGTARRRPRAATPLASDPRRAIRIRKTPKPLPPPPPAG